MNVNTPEPLFFCEETLEKFVLVDAEMLSKVISQWKAARCLLDPIHTSFFQRVYKFLDEDVVNFVNDSLQMDVFPAAFMTAMVKPLFKLNH